MGTIKYIDSTAPNNPFAPPVTVMDYQHKRGKIVQPVTRSTWDSKDANGRGHDAEQAKTVLDEALK